MLRFSLKQLQYFVAAASTASVSRASLQLNVSQPAVSAAIHHLERELDAQLFIRHHAKGLSLTPTGRRLMDEAREILSRAEQLQNPQQGRGGELHGEIEVGFFTTFGPFFIPRLLTIFQKQNPAVKVRLHEGDADSLFTGITTGNLDFAIAYDMGLGPGIQRRLLVERKPYVLMPRRHRLAGQAQIRLGDLQNETFIVHDLPHSREYFASVFGAAGVDPIVGHRTSSFELVRGLVANGHGVALLVMRPHPDRSYDGKTLVCRPTTESLPGLPIVIAQMAQARPSAAAQAFMDCTYDCFETFGFDRFEMPRSHKAVTRAQKSQT